MNFIKTEIDGVFIIEPKVFEDARGYFFESYNEAEFIKNKFTCVQNQIVLTNSSAKVLKEPVKTGKYTVLSDFIPTKAIPTQCKEL